MRPSLLRRRTNARRTSPIVAGFSADGATCLSSFATLRSSCAIFWLGVIFDIIASVSQEYFGNRFFLSATPGNGSASRGGTLQHVAADATTQLGRALIR